MKKVLTIGLIFFASVTSAQTVGIGTATPNVSAMLDIQSNTKGLLIPRMTTTERNAIPVDVTTDGLMVYDTDVKSFFYHNITGWIEISTGVAGTNYWTLASNNINNNNSGNVGIGISGTNITEKFQVDANMKVGNTVWTGVGNDRVIKFGDGTFVTIGESGQDDRMTLTGRNFIFTPSSAYPGYIGINTTTPSAPLSFGNIVGEKINFWNTDATHNYGIGVQGGLLQVHTNDATADIAFGSGISSNGAAFTETMRIKGNGNVGIGTNTPGAKLDVSGTFKLTDGTEAAGKVLTSDVNGNASWQEAGCMQHRVVFSAPVNSASFIVPAGVTRLFIEIWGGGGKGSTYTANAALQVNGGGGGSGGYANLFLNVVPLSTVIYSVGSFTSGFSSGISYGNVISVGNGTNADNITGPGGGGALITNGFQNVDVFFTKGNFGNFNVNTVYTIGATTYTEYRGGKGGDAPFGGAGGFGEIARSGYNSYSDGGSFPGGGGGAATSSGTAVNYGANGAVIIRY